MTFKVVSVLALLAVAHAGIVAGPLGGVSTSSRQQDDWGNYNFNYQIRDGLGATNGRWEAGNGGGGVVGSYNLADIDGRARRVDYVADGAGFRAKVKTNEPGTAASLPAAAVIASPYPGHVSVGPVAGPAVAARVAVAAPIGYGAGIGIGGAGIIGKGLIGGPIGYGAGIGIGGAGIINQGLIGGPIGYGAGIGIGGAGIIGGKGLIGAPGIIGGGVIGAPGLIGGAGLINGGLINGGLIGGAPWGGAGIVKGGW